MKSVEAKITGISPLLMHRFPLEPVEAIDKKPPAEQAELGAYRMLDSDHLYIPAVNLQRSLVTAALYSKGKGRASLAKIAAAAIFIGPEHLDLGVKNYEVDARPVVIPSTKGRIIRYRPRIDEWVVNFTIEFNENLLTAEQVRRIVDDAGSLVGVLDFRPACKGPFGRFRVDSWN